MSSPASEEVTRDLVQRIQRIESMGTEELGEFTPMDWLLTVVGAVLIPALLLWWYAP